MVAPFTFLLIWDIQAIFALFIHRNISILTLQKGKEIRVIIMLMHWSLLASTLISSLAKSKRCRWGLRCAAAEASESFCIWELFKHRLWWNVSRWIRICPANMILKVVAVGPGVWCIPSVERICKCNDYKLMWFINSAGICFWVSHVKHISNKDIRHTMLCQRIPGEIWLIYLI